MPLTMRDIVEALKNSTEEDRREILYQWHRFPPPGTSKPVEPYNPVTTPRLGAWPRPRAYRLPHLIDCTLDGR